MQNRKALSVEASKQAADIMNILEDKLLVPEEVAARVEEMLVS